MSTTRQRYEAKILQVQLFIQSHLDEELALERLAEVAGYSTYHFHRVFSGIVGENTDAYVRRLRMERAAQSLRYRNRTVLEIALDAGYGSHEAFTRAFARTFGVTPSEYQSMQHPPISLKESVMNAVSYTAKDVRTERMPPCRMAFMRVVGQYSHATLGPAFGRMIQWAVSQRLMGPKTICLGVYHDDPEVTAPEKQRADVGITVDDGFKPLGEGDVQVQTLPGGMCAVLRYKGHYDKIAPAWRWLYSVWLPDSGREPGNAPPYEIYVNDASKLPPEEWLTDICIPLAE
jgi:AraC family transcriptional regulator